jgi:hypothetical protein
MHVKYAVYSGMLCVHFLAFIWFLDTGKVNRSGRLITVGRPWRAVKVPQ